MDGGNDVNRWWNRGEMMAEWMMIIGGEIEAEWWRKCSNNRDRNIKQNAITISYLSFRHYFKIKK